MGIVLTGGNRRLIEDDVLKANRTKIVNNLLGRIGAQVKAKGISIKDVERIIREIRSSPVTH